MDLQKKHIEQVLETSKGYSTIVEQKMNTKLETALKNREQKLQIVREKLAEHVSQTEHHNTTHLV